MKQKPDGICKKEYVVYVMFGVYVVAVLWITLFSRIGTYERKFLYPFQSYVALANGDASFLEENVENVLLFVPLGMFIGLTKDKSLKKTLVIGGLASLCIECAQMIFALGTFECDDLLHNTIGTLIGYLAVRKLASKFQIQINLRRILTIVIAAAIGIAAAFGIKEMKHQHMIRLAALYDRVDAKNLLVLNGDSGNISGTNVYVQSLDDGSIHISGTSDIRISWWRLAEITAEPGIYTFTGLSRVEENTVGLELEVNGRGFTEDVGPVDEVQFVLEETTELKAYVVVYDGCDCDVAARPAIFKEE